MLALGTADFSWFTIIFALLNGVATVCVGWRLSKKMDQARLSHEILDATISRNRELKKEAYFRFISEVENSLMVLSRCSELPPNEIASALLSGKLAESLMIVHLVASPSLAEKCLLFGRWSVRTLPTIAKNAVQLQISAMTRDVSADRRAFQMELIPMIVECRRCELAVIKEMRKELCIDLPGEWEQYEEVWEGFLATVPSEAEKHF